MSRNCLIHYIIRKNLWISEVPSLLTIGYVPSIYPIISLCNVMNSFYHSLRNSMTIFKTIIVSPRFNLFLRFVIGGIFVYAGFMKLIDPKAFAKVISQYDLIPEILLAPVALGLPLLEFIAGLALIFNIRGSLTAIFSMLVLFVFILWYGILNDLSIDCGCFTPAEIADQNSLKKAFYRDLLLIGAVFVVYLQRYILSDRRLSPRSWLINLL